MRVLFSLGVLVLFAACAKDNTDIVSDTAQCVGQVAPVQYNFGAPSGIQKAAVYNCQDIKGKSCTYVLSLADTTVSATNCEGPIVTDGRGL